MLLNFISDSSMFKVEFSCFRVRCPTPEVEFPTLRGRFAVSVVPIVSRFQVSGCASRLLLL